MYIYDIYTFFYLLFFTPSKAPSWERGGEERGRAVVVRTSSFVICHLLLSSLFVVILSSPSSFVVICHFPSYLLFVVFFTVVVIFCRHLSSFVVSLCVKTRKTKITENLS